MRTSTTNDGSVHPAVIVAGATVAAVLTWTVARVAGVDMEVEGWGGQTMEVDLVAVTLAALGASLAGWGLFALLNRRSQRARQTWTAAAVAALLASLPGPLFADASAGARIALTSMHLAVGAVLIPGLRAALATRRSSDVHRSSHRRTLVSPTR